MNSQVFSLLLAIKSVEQTVEFLVIWDALMLMWRHCIVCALFYLRKLTQI